MSAPAPISRQIRLEQLWPELRGLAARLWSAGLTSKRLHAVWRASVVVECDACGTRLSEEDLLAILDLPEGAEPPVGRLQRLAQGYCLKPSCESRFFRITLAPDEDIDWARMLAGGTQAKPIGGAAADPPERTPAPAKGLAGSGKMRLALAILALLAALLLRHWYLNGRVPFLNQTFKVAPAEGSGPAAPAPADDPFPVRPPTNGFRVAP